MPMENQKPAMQSNNDCYMIYQLKRDDETGDYRFVSLAHLKARGFSVDMERYDLIYTAALSTSDTLESLYHKFNTAHPADFRGHSLSVSDIVVMQRNGKSASYYVDAFGFSELSFL